MNILLLDPSGLGAFRFIINGIKTAFEVAGYRTMWWDGTQDLSAFGPNLYIGCSAKLQSVPKPIKDKFGTKTCYHVNPYGVKIDKGAYKYGRGLVVGFSKRS